MISAIFYINIFVILFPHLIIVINDDDDDDDGDGDDDDDDDDDDCEGNLNDEKEMIKKEK